jgi:hypothetical protein
MWAMMDPGLRVVEIAPEKFMLVDQRVVDDFAAGKPPTPYTIQMGVIRKEEQKRTEKYTVKLKNLLPVSISKDPLVVQRSRISELSINDEIVSLKQSVWEASLMDSTGEIQAVLNDTPGETKVQFLSGVRDIGKKLGNVTDVLITTSLDGKRSYNHHVYDVRRIPVTTQKLSDILTNDKGGTPLFIDVGHFILDMPGKVWRSLKQTWENTYDYLAVTAEWERQGMLEVGHAIRGWYSVRDSWERRAYQEVGKITQIVHRHFGGHWTRSDLINIVLAAEQTGHYWDGKKLIKGDMDPVWLEKALPAVTRLQEFFRNAQAEFSARGVEMDFVSRIKETIYDKISATEAKRDKLGGHKQAAKIEYYTDMLKEIENMQFISIPYRMLFSRKMKEFLSENDPVRARQRMIQLKTIINRNRETPTIASLLEADADGNLMIDPRDIHPATIIMNYGYNQGLEHAMLDVRDSLRLYGDRVSKWAKTKPADTKDYAWMRVPASMKLLESNPPADLEKGAKLWIRTDMVDALSTSMSFARAMNKFEKSMTWIKMAAFFNPVMMPLYNVAQLAMGGLINPLQPRTLARSIGRAYKDVGGWKSIFGKQFGERTQQYWEAMDASLASQPFNNQYSDMEAKAESMAVMTGHPVRATFNRLLSDYLIRTKQHWEKDTALMKPTAPFWAGIELFYNAIHHMAWLGDEYTRFVAFNQLRQKGHSVEDAARLAAVMLGDYADVPAKTRKYLNYVFFTPTYEISMMKFWGKMAKAGMNADVWGSILTKDPQYKAQRRMIYSLGSSATMLYGIEATMRSMGWEPDEWWRKWTKRINTPAGPREHVIVWANPANVHVRWFYTFWNIMGRDPGNLQTVPERILAAFRLKMHPLWHAMYQLGIENRSRGGEQILYAGDSFWNNAKRTLLYSLNLVAPVLTALYGKATGKHLWEGESIQLARDHYKRANREWTGFAVDVLAFQYTRPIPEVRTQQQIKRMMRQLNRDVTSEVKRTGEIRRDWITNYADRIDRELKQLQQQRARRVR